MTSVTFKDLPKKREEVLGSNKSFKDVDYNDW